MPASRRGSFAALIVLTLLLAPASASANFGLLPGLFSPIDAGSNPRVVVHGDFDGENRPDLAVLDTDAETLTIWRGGFGGRFTKGSVLAVGNDPRDVAVGDFNGDGDPDLAVSNRVDDTLSLFTGGTGAAFAPAGTVAAGNDPSAIVTGQFDGGTD